MSEEAEVKEDVQEDVQVAATEEVKETTQESAFSDSFIDSIQDEDLKSHKMWDNLKGKDADEVARYMSELKSFAGKKGDIPKEGDPQEKWDEFRMKMGRPESIDGYDFNLNQEFKDLVGEGALPYYDKVTDLIKQSAFDSGLSPEKADAALDGFLSLAAEQTQAMQKELEERATENDKALRTEWGDRYDSIQDSIAAALKQNGMSDEQVSWAQESGLFKEPALAIPLGKLVARLADDPEIGHHQTTTMSGIRDQLDDVNSQLRPYIKSGEKIPDNLLRKRDELYSKIR